MVDMLQNYWWVFLALWIITKISRKAETVKSAKQESNTSDAENLMLNLVRSVHENVEDKSMLDKVLNEAASGLGNDNSYQRVLVDGLISQVEKDEVKVFTPVKGSHPLSQLADRAVKAETKKQKVVRGLKKGAAIGLKILRGGLA